MTFSQGPNRSVRSKSSQSYGFGAIVSQNAPFAVDPSIRASDPPSSGDPSAQPSPAVVPPSVSGRPFEKPASDVVSEHATIPMRTDRGENRDDRRTRCAQHQVRF
jgi:hypothetical protein